jgi:hypothetical protein
LIRTKTTDTVSKIPILGDIPLLGWLFRSKTTSTDKTNLVILMTPHIVRQYEKIRAILDRKLKERDDFLEANSGGDDPQRWKRDEIIRSLPNIDEIKNNHPPSTVTIDEDEPVKTPAAKPAPAATVVPPPSPPAPVAKNTEATTSSAPQATLPAVLVKPEVPPTVVVKPLMETPVVSPPPPPVIPPTVPAEPPQTAPVSDSPPSSGAPVTVPPPSDIPPTAGT